MIRFPEFSARLGGTLIIAILALAMADLGLAEPPNPNANRERPPRPFSWVNPLRRIPTGVQHATFTSKSMNREVGYCIYLPPGYQAESNATLRYPVVYYLHGGRPGSETKSVHLVSTIHHHISKRRVPPAIYVFVNGGPVSHYNMPGQPDAQGEDVFVKELIPHIDATYRTIAHRDGRGLEGFSQGGRGATRILFKHPDLFSSAAAGGGGHATEKRISEEGGRESASLQFSLGDNTWDLAKRYAEHPVPKPRILVYVGTKDPNYVENLEYLEFLKTLGIPCEQLVVKNVAHNARQVYARRGLNIMMFHAENFLRAASARGE